MHDKLEGSQVPGGQRTEYEGRPQGGIQSAANGSLGSSHRKLSSASAMQDCGTAFGTVAH